MILLRNPPGLVEIIDGTRNRMSGVCYSIVLFYHLPDLQSLYVRTRVQAVFSINDF